MDDSEWGFDSLSNVDVDELLYSTNYEREDERLNSFNFWIINDVSKEKLACAGFYHVKEDHVQCFMCNVVIGNWGRGDDPFIEHIIHSNECPFIRREPTNNVPIDKETLEKELSELNLNNGDGYKTTKLINNAHPSYKTVERRMLTFENWPKGLNQTPEELSRAGFFYLGTSDEVKCFNCGKCLKGWEKDDKPDEEHKRHFWDSCQFIREYYKESEQKSQLKGSGKSSSQQINYLVEYMNGEPDLANGVINNSNDRRMFNFMWNNLTEQLNRLGPAQKPPKSWREVWRNVKYNRKKGTKRPHSNQSSGNCNVNSIQDCNAIATRSENIPKPLEFIIPSAMVQQYDCNVNFSQVSNAFPSATIQQYDNRIASTSASTMEMEKLRIEKAILTLQLEREKLAIKKHKFDNSNNKS